LSKLLGEPKYWGKGKRIVEKIISVSQLLVARAPAFPISLRLCMSSIHIHYWSPRQRLVLIFFFIILH